MSNITPSFAAFARSKIERDHWFYNEQLRLFRLDAVEEDGSKQEQPMQALYEQSFIDQFIVTDEDRMCCFLHNAGHAKCQLMWKTCPIPRDSIPFDLLGPLEEVYNQRLVSVVSPTMHNMFPLFVRTYEVYHGYSTPEKRRFQTLLTAEPNTGTVLDDVHRQLYRSDPTDMYTFNQFFTRTVHAIATDKNVQELVQVYF